MRNGSQTRCTAAPAAGLPSGSSTVPVIVSRAAGTGTTDDGRLWGSGHGIATAPRRTQAACRLVSMLAILPVAGWIREPLVPGSGNVALDPCTLRAFPESD